MEDLARAVTDNADELACSKCGSRESLVVTGLSLLPYASRSPEHADLSWAVQCWGDGCGRSTYHINDAARDELFGTGWRSATRPAPPATQEKP